MNTTIENGFLKPPGFYFLEEPPTNQGAQGDAINEKKIGEVWSKHNFDTNNKVKVENLMILKTTWGGASEAKDQEDGGETSGGEELEAKRESKSADEEPAEGLLGQEEVSPSHHARRPPNAFLIFCKKHRPIVRQRYPTTENRGVTKILGEWWALLNIAEKQPYNDLAKEYKDAFLSANPGFRWYKLPAPPLRTLATRPTTISKPAPSTVVASPTAQQVYLSEFTPGKLADESQLGGLTSLMNNNYHSGNKEDDVLCCVVENNNNNNEHLHSNEEEMEKVVNGIYATPTSNTIKNADLPPKPIKKRIYEQYEGELNCSRNIFDEKESSNMTHQDLLNKVVDGIFANDRDDAKDLQRKSDRMCKGKRYERFMVEGKLLGNKRDMKLTQHHKELTKSSQETLPFNLETTIKRLAERTKVKIDYDEEATKLKERVRTTSDPSEAKQPPQISFNLDLRIDNLPSLCYDDFVKRKRENKKRKMKFKSDSSPSKMQKVTENNNVKVEAAVGSKKRKNKSSITHLNKMEEDTLERADALLGLATLAMVAASTEKIDESATGT